MAALVTSDSHAWLRPIYARLRADSSFARSSFPSAPSIGDRDPLLSEHNERIRSENLAARRLILLSGILLTLIELAGAMGVGITLRAQTPGSSAGGQERCRRSACRRPNSRRRNPSPQLWYSPGDFSQSVGMEIPSISRAEFIDELSRQRISVAQVTLAELEEEIDRE